jgi:hypothetical protein
MQRSIRESLESQTLSGLVLFVVPDNAVIPIVGARRSPLSPSPRQTTQIENSKGFPTLFSVVEGAGRNLVDDTRKADKRDDRKDADPLREAHGLRLRYCGERSPQSGCEG